MITLGSADQRGTLYQASDSPAADQWVWQIEPMCAVRGGDCVPGEFCAGADQGVYMRIEVRPLAQPGPSAPGPPPGEAPGNITAFGPPFAGTPVGTAYGSWLGAGEGCVNIDGLNLPPTPEEVYEQFILLPIPGLGFSVQPVDLGLVNLPEIFYTTEPSTGEFTVGIRGYSVVLSTRVAQFNWYTGDPAEPVVVSYGPGLPYPYQYVTHTYLARGDYPAQLETYWQATYTIDGGPSYAAPGNVRTVGPARTISVVEAHAVLTDPYD